MHLSMAPGEKLLVKTSVRTQAAPRHADQKQTLFSARRQLLSRVQLFATPWTVAHQGPLVRGILQAGILEKVAFPFSGGSSQPRDGTQVSHIAGGFFTI